MKLLRPALLGMGVSAFAVAVLTFVPIAEAQFFWSPFFQEQPRAKPKPRKPATAPGDDLPPIVPKESSVPPPPDDRPYDVKLMRLAEILGAVHYLRELCGAQEGQLWRDQMQQILKNEGSTAARRAKLVNSFNDGYRGYRRTYRTCTSSATLAVTRFSTEGAQIAQALAKPSLYASRNAAAEQPATPTATDGTAAPKPEGDATATGQGDAGQGEGAKPTPEQGAEKNASTGEGETAGPKKPEQAHQAKVATPQQVDQNKPRINR